MIKNNINNLLYVGMTVKSLSQRFKEHVRTALHYDGSWESKLYKAMQKYGVDNFFIELLEDFPDRNDRNSLGEMEKLYIGQLDTVNNGYNISLGGNGGAIYNNLSQDQQDEIREKIKLKAIGRNRGIKQSPEFIEKRSKAHTHWYQCLVDGDIVLGRKNIHHHIKYWIRIDSPNSQLGVDVLRMYQEEWEIAKRNAVEKMADTQVKRRLSDRRRWLEDNACLVNFVVAHWQMGYSKEDTITKFQITSSQYQLIYKYVIRSLGIKREVLPQTRYGGVNRRAVMNLDTGEVFNSVAEANKRYCCTTIADCCRGRQESAAGYKWRYCNG